ncbi:hypothetical protein AMECASPLE_012512 [Ameca splendens]|uniref:Uncharacterized protein n=1 Tax=Ameca splendens TaxID=208324 RepID=A0ABV0ZAV1_9TELE
MVLCDRVETDRAVLLGSIEGLSIVRSAAKQTSPHTHPHCGPGTHTLMFWLQRLLCCWFHSVRGDARGAVGDGNSCFWRRVEQRPSENKATCELWAYSATFVL